MLSVPPKYFTSIKVVTIILLITSAIYVFILFSTYDAHYRSFGIIGVLVAIAVAVGRYRRRPTRAENLAELKATGRRIDARIIAVNQESDNPPRFSIVVIDPVAPYDKYYSHAINGSAITLANLIPEKASPYDIRLPTAPLYINPSHPTNYLIDDQDLINYDMHHSIKTP